MSHEPNDPEFTAVLNLPPEKRYRHFVERIVDYDLVWMAEDEDGLLTFNTQQGGEILPVWPARRYAQHVLKDNFPDARYIAIAVRDWLEDSLHPWIDEDDFELAIFPDADGESCPVSCADMIADVEAELGTRMAALPGFDGDATEIDLDELLKPAMKASMTAKPKGKLP